MIQEKQQQQPNTPTTKNKPTIADQSMKGETGETCGMHAGFLLQWATGVRIYLQNITMSSWRGSKCSNGLTRLKRSFTVSLTLLDVIFGSKWWMVLSAQEASALERARHELKKKTVSAQEELGRVLFCLDSSCLLLRLPLHVLCRLGSN